MDSNPGGGYNPLSGFTAAEALKEYRREGNHFRRYLFARNYCKGMNVLDYGCGSGVGYLILKDHIKSYTGIDLDTEAIHWATTYLKSPKSKFYTVNDYLSCSASVLFDIAISFEVIEHVSDPLAYLRFLKTSIKDGGTIIISTPNGLWSNGDKNLFRTNYHLFEYSPQEINEFLKPLFKNIVFYKEKRIDNLDFLGFKIQHMDNRTNKYSDGRVSSTKTMAHSIVDFAYRHLNGPSFWKIQKTEFESMNALDYSTIVVTARNS